MNDPVRVSDLLQAASPSQPVTVYDRASGRYVEFDILAQREDRLVLIRSSDLHDPAPFIEYVREQLGKQLEQDSKWLEDDK